MKERLIGAAVLAILAVWLIPWLLDGPDEPLPEDVSALELPVPSGHVGEIRTEVIDLSRRNELPGASVTSDSRTATPASARAGDSGAAAAGSADASGAAASRSSGAAVSPSSGAAVSPSSGAAVGDRSAAESGGPGEGSGSSAASAAASGSGDTAGSGDAPAATGGTERAATGSEVPRTDSSATATSSTAAASQPSTQRATSAAASGDWAVQLGSFGDEENARRLADRVSAFGHSPRISTYRAGGRVMYRVRIGPHATRGAAEAAASALAAHGFVAQVVTN